MGLDKEISIHALREEGDAPSLWSRSTTRRFLSTPSARRATNDQLGHIQMLAISIHALREEGDPVHTCSSAPCWISIHALREEGDPTGGSGGSSSGDFYPRPPRGGRRKGRSGADQTLQHFYPRPPRGGRPGPPSNSSRQTSFLSTPSARRATRRSGCTSQLTQNFYPRPPRGGRPPAAR